MRRRRKRREKRLIGSEGQKGKSQSRTSLPLHTTHDTHDTSAGSQIEDPRDYATRCYQVHLMASGATDANHRVFHQIAGRCDYNRVSLEDPDSGPAPSGTSWSGGNLSNDELLPKSERHQGIADVDG